jgi:hypothetical protein
MCTGGNPLARILAKCVSEKQKIGANNFLKPSNSANMRDRQARQKYFDIGLKFLSNRMLSGCACLLHHSYAETLVLSMTVQLFHCSIISAYGNRALK